MKRQSPSKQNENPADLLVTKTEPRDNELPTEILPSSSSGARSDVPIGRRLDDLHSDLVHSSTTGTSRKRKRSPKRSYMEHAQCKICLQTFFEPFSTICGHTFCRQCITQHLMQTPRCPICDSSIDLKKTKIIPNYTASELVQILTSQELAKPDDADEDGEAIVRMIMHASPIPLSSIKRINEALQRKTQESEFTDEQLRNILVNEFLERMIEKRESQRNKIDSQLERLRADKQKVEALIKQGRSTALAGQLPTQQRVVPDSALPLSETTSLVSESAHSVGLEDEGHSQSSFNAQDFHISRPTFDDSPNTQKDMSSLYVMPEQLNKYRRRLNKHICSLENSYFKKDATDPVAVSTALAPPTSANQSLPSSQSQQTQAPLGSCTDNDLEEFSQIVRGMAQYGDMKRLATINYNAESSSSALSIVSSLEFDKDGEYFVIAGVTKKIKLYDYNAVVRHNTNTHYPVEQLQAASKISNVSWNPYMKHLLASSDYDGIVQLWDTEKAKPTRMYKEHEKRCWTVQFNNVDPYLMASGSDDAKVKLWSISCPQSTCTIDAKVNVCCVYFSPKNRNNLVFGSADHCVHSYDIRYPSKPLKVLHGHRKAVSYVKYCNETEVVSASTDSNLRIWDVTTGKCLQIMSGHQNEKNFVGLATDGNHVVCGSENNHLYLYYKNISKPLMSFDFSSKTVDHAVGSSSTPGGTSLDPEFSGSSPGCHSAESTRLGTTNNATDSNGSNSDFVSAVCWKKNTNVIVAANSQGTTHILQLE
ncbi:zinc finger, c3HC4 type (RING finger) domain-containing protein [Ditylenchus destructor]|nr:zinc finger, c3HC4 type (RING finger) domain-containing protein [Ditylenchus destructor]